jgi:AraC family transcriptional activator of pyochelin receptor
MLSVSSSVETINSLTQQGSFPFAVEAKHIADDEGTGMNIQLLKSGGGHEVAREVPAMHKMDTAFESFWQLDGGYLKKIRFKPGFDLYVMDYDPEGHLKMYSHAWPTGFGFKFFLSGAMKYLNCAVKEEMIMAGGFNRFSFFPVSKGSGQRLSRDRVKAVTIAMAPSFFSTLSQDASTCPAGFLDTLPEKPFFHINPNTAAMEAAVRDIFNCAYHGAIRKIFLESKALELVAHQLGRVFPSETFHPISCDEREKVELARDMLVKHMDNPPSFLTLARMVGLPHNRLSQLFRTTYGTTPFTLLRDIRLERARLMLEEKQGSVTEIALGVGYASLSHFAKEFRKKFRVSPKQFQLRNHS